MAINFMPNDPLAANDIGLRPLAQARRNRPASRASITMPTGPQQAPYAFGTPQFLFWQAREAVLTTLEMWESLNGPVKKWARSPNAKRLQLGVDEGEDLNAYYDGTGLRFFHATDGVKVTYSGASTDCVSHEVGHALLDVIRPQLWDANSVETAAFHEAFGDCVALLTALYDQPTRQKLLTISPTLKDASFAEALLEDLADGVRRALGPLHPSAQPRHALNRFKWALPTTLPSSGPPATLAREVHSFGRVFDGCFYDLICELYAAQPAKGEAHLWTAAATAGRLLIAAASNAPIVARFFQAIGRAMVLADEQQSGGASKAAIGKAFANHGIVLGSAAMMAPRAALRGPPPRRKGGGVQLTAATTSDLSRRFAVRGLRPMVGSLVLGSKPVAETIFKRPVNCGQLHPKLAGVVAMGLESVLVGESNKRAALVSAAPEKSTTEDEVLAFVEALLYNNHLQLKPPATKQKAAVVKGKRAVAGKIEKTKAMQPTHAIKRRAGKKMIERVRFACGCRPLWRI